MFAIHFLADSALLISFLTAVQEVYPTNPVCSNT